MTSGRWADLRDLMAAFETARQAAEATLGLIDSAIEDCGQAREANVQLITEAERSARALKPLEDGVVSRAAAAARSHLNLVSPGALDGEPATGAVISLEANVRLAENDSAAYEKGLLVLTEFAAWLNRLQMQLAANVEAAQAMRTAADVPSAMKRGEAIWRWYLRDAAVPAAIQHLVNRAAARSPVRATPGSLAAACRDLSGAMARASDVAAGMHTHLGVAQNW